MNVIYRNADNWSWIRRGEVIRFLFGMLEHPRGATESLHSSGLDSKGSGARLAGLDFWPFSNCMAKLL